MRTAPLQILLVEDDELFRLGLATRLQQEEGLVIAAEASDGETAIEFAAHQPFDIVILDVGLPGIGGIEACRQIKQRQPNLPVLVLTSHSQPALIAQLIEARAQGYCVKGIAAKSLVWAVRSVAAGASWWDSTATNEIQAAFNQTSATDSSSVTVPADMALTKREHEILVLIAAGKSNQEIAEQLYIALGTVRVHVHTILQKLDVRDRTQAAILAHQKGLVEATNF